MAKVFVQKLRCEYKENPLGIDAQKPRLSWQLESTERSVMQSSYCLQVSEEDN